MHTQFYIYIDLCVYIILINQNKIVYISMYTLIHMPYTLTHNTLTYSFNKSTTHCLIIYMLIFKKFCPYIMHWDIKKNIFTVEILAI